MIVKKNNSKNIYYNTKHMKCASYMFINLNHLTVERLVDNSFKKLLILFKGINNKFKWRGLSKRHTKFLFKIFRYKYSTNYKKRNIIYLTNKMIKLKIDPIISFILAHFYSSYLSYGYFRNMDIINTGKTPKYITLEETIKDLTSPYNNRKHLSTIFHNRTNFNIEKKYKLISLVSQEKYKEAELYLKNEIN